MREPLVAQRVEEIVCLVLDVDPDVARNLSAEESPEWDSLRHIEIILAVEDEFGIVIPEELFASVGTLDAMTAFVEGTRAAR